MAQKLVVVESPAKAKTIEKYLGKDYKVLASVGHVRDLPESSLGVTVDNGFALEYVVNEDKHKVIDAIAKAAKRAESVYLATDYDREGEAIAWHVAEAAGIPPEKRNRVTFTEITRRAVTEAFDHPREIDSRLVDAQQARRAKDAQLEAERVISDKQRELEQTKAANAALIAEAEAKKQTALGVQRVAELDATQIAQAKADAEKLRIDAEARARAEAIRITTVAQAQAESIQRVNEAIKAGGESYFRYRQIEMIPQIAPVIADALAKAKLVTISGDNSGGGAADSVTNNITSVIQTVLAAQLVSNSGILQPADRETVREIEPSRENGREAPPVKALASTAQQPPTTTKTGFR